MKTFYMFGFYALLLVVICCGILFIKINPMKINGQVSWADLYSNNSAATAEFLNKTMGIESQKTENNDGMDYTLIKGKKALFPSAGIMQITDEWRKEGLVPHSTLYFTVINYDETEQKMLENGAKTLVPATIKYGMKFGIYMIPGDLDIAIVQYQVK